MTFQLEFPVYKLPFNRLSDASHVTLPTLHGRPHLYLVQYFLFTFWQVEWEHILGPNFPEFTWCWFYLLKSGFLHVTIYSYKDNTIMSNGRVTQLVECSLCMRKVQRSNRCPSTSIFFIADIFIQAPNTRLAFRMETVLWTFLNHENSLMVFVYFLVVCERSANDFDCYWKFGISDWYPSWYTIHPA